MPVGDNEKDIDPEWFIEDEAGWWKNTGNGGSGGPPVWPPYQPPGGPFELPPELAAALSMESPTEYGPRRKRRRGMAMPQERVPIPAYAFGGSHPGGPALVGELGPEVVDLPAGSSVHPNFLAMLLSMLGGQGGGGQQPLGAAQRAFKGMPAYAYGTPDVWMQPRPQPTFQAQQPAQRSNRDWAAGLSGGSWGRGGGGGPWGGGGGYGGGGGWTPPPPPPKFDPPKRGGLRPGDIDYSAFYDPEGKDSLPKFLKSLVLEGIGGGVFDVLGSQAVSEQARDYVSSRAGAEERHAQLGADLDAGGDPALTAYARTQARLGNQQRSSQAYLDAMRESGIENRNRLNMLYQMLFGAATRRDPKDDTGSDIMGMLGQLGGVAIGSIGGPPGAAAGATLAQRSLRAQRGGY